MAGTFAFATGGDIGAAIVETQSRSPSANAGLIWSRYFPLWRGSRASPERKARTQGRSERDEGSEKQDGSYPILKSFAESCNAAGRSAVSDLDERWQRTERALDHLAKSRGRALKIVDWMCVWSAPVRMPGPSCDISICGFHGSRTGASRRTSAAAILIGSLETLW
jgi:hypothetical protein